MTSILLAALASGTAQVATSGVCRGADTAIVGVKKMPPVVDANDVNTYRVAVTVENVGTKSQSGNVLDSVAMFVDGHRTDVKGLQPLASGASQTVIFSVRRAADAGMGTTNLRFTVTYGLPIPAGMQDCDPANDVATARL